MQKYKQKRKRLQMKHVFTLSLSLCFLPLSSRCLSRLLAPPTIQGHVLASLFLTVRSSKEKRSSTHTHLTTTHAERRFEEQRKYESWKIQTETTAQLSVCDLCLRPDTSVRNPCNFFLNERCSVQSARCSRCYDEWLQVSEYKRQQAALQHNNHST